MTDTASTEENVVTTETTGTVTDVKTENTGTVTTQDTTANTSTATEGTTPLTDGTADENAEGAPETYEDFTLPEGVELNDVLVEEFVPVAKELNLSQEAAQKLVDLQANFMAKNAEAQWEQWNTTKAEWLSAAQADAEVGGNAFKENLATAKLALDKFGTDELREAFDTTGVGNHPEIIRFVVRVGKMLKEDTIHSANTGKPKENQTAAERLFPNMK